VGSWVCVPHELVVRRRGDGQLVAHHQQTPYRSTFMTYFKRSESQLVNKFRSGHLQRCPELLKFWAQNHLSGDDDNQELPQSMVNIRAHLRHQSS
jgi:hypothetical protein